MKNLLWITRIILVLILAHGLVGTTVALADGNPHDCTNNPTDPACQNPTDTGCNANNPKNCPQPTEICELGQHTGNPHCNPTQKPPEPTEPPVPTQPEPTQPPEPTVTEPPAPTETQPPVPTVTEPPEVTNTPGVTPTKGCEENCVTATLPAPTETLQPVVCDGDCVTSTLVPTVTGTVQASPIAPSVPHNNRPPKTGAGDTPNLAFTFSEIFGSLAGLWATMRRKHATIKIVG